MDFEITFKLMNAKVLKMPPIDSLNPSVSTGQKLSTDIKFDLCLRRIASTAIYGHEMVYPYGTRLRPDSNDHANLKVG
jgi:hypothetical protein